MTYLLGFGWLLILFDLITFEILSCRWIYIDHTLKCDVVSPTVKTSPIVW